MKWLYPDNLCGLSVGRGDGFQGWQSKPLPFWSWIWSDAYITRQLMKEGKKGDKEPEIERPPSRCVDGRFLGKASHSWFLPSCLRCADSTGYPKAPGWTPNLKCSPIIKQKPFPTWDKSGFLFYGISYYHCGRDCRKFLWYLMLKIQYQQESCLSYQPFLYCAKVKHSQFPGSLTETLKFNSVSKSYFTQETSVASGELDEEKKKTPFSFRILFVFKFFHHLYYNLCNSKQSKLLVSTCMSCHQFTH